MVPERRLRDLVSGLNPAYGLPYGPLDLSHVLVVPIPLPGPEKASEAIPAPSGNHMHMEVRDALADAIVDGDERAVSIQCQFNRAGQHLDVR